MGNIFAIRPGLKEGPATYAGSHLDTQPHGGRYDGILGIHAGIEALRTMNEKGIETEYPTGVINWSTYHHVAMPFLRLGLILLTPYPNHNPALDEVDRRTHPS